MTYTELYKFNNFLEIAKLADAELKKDDAALSVSEELDFDWFLRFYEAAGGISNEEMRALWAKVLAGEITQQGSFSLRTVETLRNMTAREARVFQRASHLVLSEIDGGKFLFCDDTIGNYDLNKRHGLDTRDLFLLEECGLVNAFCVDNYMELDDAAGGLVSGKGQMLLFRPVRNEKTSFHYRCYPLTRAAMQLLARAAMQLLAIVCDDEYDDYLLELGKILKAENKDEFQISLHDITGALENDEVELDMDHDYLLDE